MSTRERPILFSAPMVRAILDGSKTQTRRVVKGIEHDRARLVGLPRLAPEWVFEDPEHRAVKCPYGTKGDRLWVRERWAKAPGNVTIYWADDPVKYPTDGAWRPSIHMRRADSRIDLEVTDVRVERLQEITEEDARAEGFERCTDCTDEDEHGAWSHFAAAWDDLNFARGVGWDTNPWVWVVSFRRIVQREGVA